MQIELEKGRTSVGFTLSEKKILGVLLGKDVPGITEEAIAEIISDGIKQHAPPGVSGMKTLIIIPDDTRLWARGDLFVPVIVKALFDLGLCADKVKILIALGSHRDIEEEKFALLVGDYAAAHVEILNSANRDESRLEFLGETQRNTRIQLTKEAVEAEHVIIYGGVLHHMLAGYGGGRKYIFPGIAGYNGIQQNHSLAMQEDGSPHPLVCQTQLAGNPVHEDIMEVAELFLENRTCTYAAIAANGKGEIFHAEVGSLQETFLNSCKKLDDVCCAPVSAKGDFALISAGGHRADGQLYQATKALFNCVNVVKEGGKILFVAGCSEGAGNSIFSEMLTRYKGDKKTLGKNLTHSFNMPSYVAFRVLDLLDRFEVSLVSDLSSEQTEDLGFKYVEDLKIYVNNLQGKGYVIPYAENILPVIDAV